jgi:hypothetical protein
MTVWAKYLYLILTKLKTGLKNPNIKYGNKTKINLLKEKEKSYTSTKKKLVLIV